MKINGNEQPEASFAGHGYPGKLNAESVECACIRFLNGRQQKRDETWQLCLDGILRPVSQIRWLAIAA